MSILDNKEYENYINSLDLNIKGGCNRCVHHNHKMDFIDNELKSIKSCKLNNADTLNEWWRENGKKTSKDETTNNDCFEASIHEKALTNLNNDAKKCIGYVKEI